MYLCICVYVLKYGHVFMCVYDVSVRDICIKRLSNTHYKHLLSSEARLDSGKLQGIRISKHIFDRWNF